MMLILCGEYLSSFKTPGIFKKQSLFQHKTLFSLEAQILQVLFDKFLLDGQLMTSQFVLPSGISYGNIQCIHNFCCSA